MLKVTNIYEELGWEVAEGYPVGTRTKILRDENNSKTVLFKLPPGFFLNAHSHVTAEQHFVLEGEYESEGKIYGAGTYQLIPAEVDHGPFKSDKGAVILVIWDPY